MQPSRLLVLASFVASVAILAFALFSTSSMRHQMETDPASTVIGFFVVGALCSWPWLKAFAATKNKAHVAGPTVFSLVSVSIVAFFAKPIATAPEEGIGWNIVICVLFVWAASLLIKLGRPA